MALSNISEAAVWGTADKYLRNIVEPEDYGDYILPFTVLARLEGILAPTKQQVLEMAAISQAKGESREMLDWQVETRFDLAFNNTSPFDLQVIASVDDHPLESLYAYLDGFSSNMQDVWTRFKFKEHAETLDNANRLWPVIKHFATLVPKMTLEAMPDAQMGDLFEDIMYRAFNTKGKNAGAFYTPRDAIRLMVDILFASDDDGLTRPGASRTIYDPTAGTGGMLLVAKRALEELNPDIEIVLAGQENMETAYAIGKADLLIQGGDPDAIRFGNTLTEDLYASETFEYILSNPPFGDDWELEQPSVKEQAKQPGSRFSHGLPSKDDGQMLFLSHVASKLKPSGPNGSGGRAAVVSNGSPLFTGTPGSGADSIRSWLLNSDLVDAVIEMPEAMFYGTGISTYVWILDTNKEEHRKGFIQLIDASDLWETIPKTMGFKRRVISDEQREVIAQEYHNFENTKRSRVMTADDFGFRVIPVKRQARLRFQFDDATRAAFLETANATEDHAAILDTLAEVGTKFNDLPDAMKKEAKQRGVKVTAGVIDNAMKLVGVPDAAEDLSFTRKGEVIFDPSFTLGERVALSEDIEEHMQREVVPYAEDVHWDESKGKVGYEIPIKRIFYKPKQLRDLEAIDADVAQVMDSLSAKFAEVRK